MSHNRTAVDKAWAALNEHMKRHRHARTELITPGTPSSEEFDRLYLAWIQARWDAGDSWVRKVWPNRPNQQHRS